MSSSFSVISNLSPSSPHSNIHNFHTFFISNHNKPPQTSFLFSKFCHHSSIFHNTLAAKRLRFAASILPDADRWTLPKHPEEDDAEPTAAMLALRRMWDLVADERWVALGAFGSLVIAAVSFSIKQCFQFTININHKNDYVMLHCIASSSSAIASSSFLCYVALY
jgi:hypothetical protein